MGSDQRAPAEQQRGELTARAVVFERGERKLAFVSLDLLGFPSVLCDRVRARVPAVPGENILIASTHNHSGPDCYAFPDGQGGHTGDLQYLESVCVKTAEAIRAALENLQPAHLRIATGEAGPDCVQLLCTDLYDRRMSVIQAVTPDGDPIVTLVNYATHPEVLGSDAGILSPDLVGPLCERLESTAGGTALFVNGAQGGMVTADNRDLEKPADAQRAYWQDKRTWEECVRIGHTMADEALSHYCRCPASKDPNALLHGRQRDVPRGIGAAVERSPIFAAEVSTQRRPQCYDACQRRALGKCSNPHHPRRGITQYRLLSQTQDARRT